MQIGWLFMAVEVDGSAVAAKVISIADMQRLVQVATGLVANTIILGIALGLWAIYRRVKG